MSYFFFLYQSLSSSLCTIFDAISSNINEVLSINTSATVFVFGDFNVHFNIHVALDISFDRIWHAGLLHKYQIISSSPSNRRLWVVLDGKSPQEYPDWSCTFPTINDLPDDIIFIIAIYVADATLYSKCDQTSDLWQQLELASESDLWDTMDWAGSDLLISMLENLSWFSLTGLITLVLLMWKWVGLFLRKNHLLR